MQAQVNLQAGNFSFNVQCGLSYNLQNIIITCCSIEFIIIMNFVKEYFYRVEFLRQKNFFSFESVLSFENKNNK